MADVSDHHKSKLKSLGAKGTNHGGNWIAGAIKHPGAFTKKAKAAGTSVAGMEKRVLAKPGKYSTQTVRQANLAKTLGKIRRN